MGHDMDKGGGWKVSWSSSSPHPGNCSRAMSVYPVFYSYL